jgi:hypothetical protein
VVSEVRTREAAFSQSRNKKNDGRSQSILPVLYDEQLKVFSAITRFPSGDVRSSSPVSRFLALDRRALLDQSGEMPAQ